MASWTLDYYRRQNMHFQFDYVGREIGFDHPHCLPKMYFYSSSNIFMTVKLANCSTKMNIFNQMLNPNLWIHSFTFICVCVSRKNFTEKRIRIRRRRRRRFTRNLTYSRQYLFVFHSCYTIIVFFIPKH